MIPAPEVGYFSHHSGQLNSPHTENYPHMVTGVGDEIRHNAHMITATQEEIPYCSPTISSAKQKKARSTSQPQFRNVRITLRHLKQARFCWHFSNWRRTVFLPMSITILAESRNCLNLWQWRCLCLMENQGNSNCLKIYSKRVWKSTISWRKKTR